jgi:alpha-beta hydrolase superfamily lysophospholipase
MRARDESFISQRVRCRARFFPAATSPAPCVVIAHGFDGVREQALDKYAAHFCRAGISAFVFDYRYFGDSEGEPRQRFNIRAQLDDWRAAIAKVRELDEVDPARIALWGTSTSGGHVIKLAAEQQRFAAVVTQMPFTSGFAQLLLTPITHNLRLLWAGLRDQFRAWFELKGVMIAAAGRPYTLAVVTSADALSGLDAITPDPTTWRNEVYARFTLTMALYNPGRAARRVRCPLMVCIADDDRVIPLKPALKMAKRTRATLRRYRFTHFTMYYGKGFDTVVADQAAFLRKHLIADPRPLALVRP